MPRPPRPDERPRGPRGRAAARASPPPPARRWCARRRGGRGARPRDGVRGERGCRVSADFITMEPMIQAARKRLDQGTWDYLVGGTESETTLRRNRAGFDRLAFRPRIPVDASNVDPATTFLGHPLRP